MGVEKRGGQGRGGEEARVADDRQAGQRKARVTGKWKKGERHAPVRTPHGSSLMMIVVPPRKRPALSVASVSAQGA